MHNIYLLSSVHSEIGNCNSMELLKIIESINIIMKLQNIENKVQMQINDLKLTKIYNKWVKINNYRENEFINNVYKYCNENIFNTGLLITGAEHRKSLIEIINNYKSNKLKIIWKYL